MKIVFMGTPEFARDILKSIIVNNFDVVGVVTNPDRPKGRSKKLIPSPVKELALEHDIEVLQPLRPSEDKCFYRVRELSPDIIIIAAYGCILREEIINFPPLGCLNIHGSLLPNYRGASPVAQAILDGEKETGVTLQYVTLQCDAGDVISTARVKISDDDTTGSLLKKMAIHGSALLIDALEKLAAGETLPRNPQKGEEATYTSLIKKSDGKINWKKPAEYIERQIRAMNPWPLAYMFLCLKDGSEPTRIVVHKATVEKSSDELEPGTVIGCSGDGLKIATGKDILVINELQAAGRKRMDVCDFTRGCTINVGITCIDG